MHRTKQISTIAAVGVLLALTACSGSGDNASSSESAPTLASATTPSTSPTVSPASPAAAEKTMPAKPPQADYTEVTLSVRIADGKVDPTALPVYASVGQRVKIEGISDVAESLQIRGYDKTVEMKPGTPAYVIFTADTKGTFEVATQDSGKLVAKLIVADPH
ncbi:MAG TPA: hypothetical protein VFG33_40655 [Kribbella sp.]|uniref:hypothetical protein n=1 Tax=Kribbella sp. TaxID=1871183 RepID=UPI002D767E03|nr:hypothetical protein [Kribbella sp.]HET6299743.1 hypothetical protein [Kribbella sp.]